MTLNNKYMIENCDNCKESSIESELNECDNQFYIECKKCNHFIKYNHSKEINKNIKSLLIIDEMVKSISNLITSNSMHYLVGRKNVKKFNKLLANENKSKTTSECLIIIKKFLMKEKTISFENVEYPLIPNYSKGIVSGLGIFELSYSQWFFKLIDSGINPFTGKACLLSDEFYEEISVVENDITYINWNVLWKLIDKNFGLRNHRDVLESERKKEEAAKEFYYHYALENNLQREYQEVYETRHENLSNDEKRYLSYFNMHKESDEYKDRITSEKDFWLECLKRPFKEGMTWSENYFNLNEWDKCYWAHVSMLERITKGHPARVNRVVYFK